MGSIFEHKASEEMPWVVSHSSPALKVQCSARKEPEDEPGIEKMLGDDSCRMCAIEKGYVLLHSSNHDLDEMFLILVMIVKTCHNAI